MIIGCYIRSNKFLEGMKFVIVGKISKFKGNIIKEIMEFGGYIVFKIGVDIAVCISIKGK